MFLRLGPVAKSDYERTDPRTGKIEHVHDSRVKHVLTEQHPNGVYHYGIQREPGGNRVMMRISRPDGSTSEWESAMMGGLQSEGEAKKKLAQKMATAHRQGSSVEHYDPDVKGHFDAALTEHRRREAADTKARAETDARHQRESERRAQLDLDAGAAKFRKVKFSMHVIDGEPEDVEGWGIGGLVVHRVGEGRYAKYRVSHVGTGKTLGLEYDSQGQARMAAFRMSRETDWTRPAREIVQDKTLAGKIAALRIDPRGEFPEPDTASTKKSAAAFSTVGDFVKSLDLRRPASPSRAPDPLVKAFESEYPQIAALTRRVSCDCQPGSGGACSCSVTYGGATNPMKGVQTVKKSGYPETDLMRSMRGASTTQPARFSVRIVQEHGFGRANSERTAWVNKSQVVDAITKSFTSGDTVMQPSDLALLDRGIVRAAVADRLKIGVSSDQGSAPLRKAETDDPLKRAAAWLDALADEHSRR
jgi:hypothetical protein